MFDVGSGTPAAALAWGLATALLLRAGPAAAEGAGPSAEELRRRGAAAAAAHEYEKCVDAYAAALEKEPLPSTAGELGLCEEALGRNVAAHDHLLDALAGEVPSAPPPAPAMWRRYRRAADRVDRRIARVLLLVSPPAAAVFVDGRPVGSHVSGRAFAVLPGQHTWTAKLPGFADATVTHTARAGDFPDIALLLPGWPPPPPDAAPPGGTENKGIGTGGTEKAASARKPPAPTGAPVPAACSASPPPGGRSSTAGGARLSGATCGAVDAPPRGRMDPSPVLVGGGLLSAGFTADAGPGFFVGGEVHFRRREAWGFSVGADVRAVLPAKGGLRARDGNPLDISLIAVVIAPCVRYRWVMGCVFVDPGGTVAGGPGPLSFQENNPMLFVVGVGPRLALDVPVLERASLRAFADLRVSPLRADLGYVIDRVSAWTQPRVSGFFGAGVSFE